MTTKCSSAFNIHFARVVILKLTPMVSTNSDPAEGCTIRGSTATGGLKIYIYVDSLLFILMISNRCVLFSRIYRAIKVP